MPNPGIYLGSYSLTVTKHGDEQVLSDLPNGGFLPWLSRFIGTPGLRGKDSEDGLRHECDQPQMTGNHTVYGWVHSGESGFGSRFVDAETGAAEWRRRPGTAELIPFYYQAYAAPGAVTGVLVLQRFGVRSPHSFFRDEVKKAFSDDFDGLALHIRPYVAKQVLDRMKSGLVTEMKFTSANPPKELADFVAKHGGRLGDFTFETRILAKRNRGLNLNKQISRLMDKLMRRETVEPPKEWKDLGDEIRIVFNRGKSRRTIAIGTNREFHPYEDVTDRVKRDDNAHPTLASIHRIANEVVYDVRDELRIHYAR